MTLTLDTPALRFTLGANPLDVEALMHRATGRPCVARGRQRFAIRLTRRASDPVLLTEVRDVAQTTARVDFTVTDEADRFRAFVCIEATPVGLSFSARAEGPEPLWMFEWRLDGLDLDEVIVPALGGQCVSRGLPAGVRLAYKYPFWWNAQFALGAFDGGGLWLRTMETDPRLKVLRVQKTEMDERCFTLGLGLEADGGAMGPVLSGSWFLDGFSGGWEGPAERHRQWMADAFGLQPRAEHPRYPAWMDEINFVLEIWGMHRELGEPMHTFDEMIGRIEAFAALHPPAETLLYLPGFAVRGIDTDIPDYHPAVKMGGADGLQRLVDAAHRLGYRVMVHTNVLGMAYDHPLFERFEACQVVDPFGRPQGWAMDLDGDWLAEPYFAYINPGERAWSAHMATVLGELVHTFELDAVFLDQTLLAFNVTNGPNFLEGMRRHVSFLQQRFPDVLFAGEGQHEHTLAVLPVAQIHGIDSLFEVHGAEGQQPWRHVHPVSMHVFGPYCRFLAHLLTKHPSSAFFARQEAAYARLGVVPALVLYHRGQEMDLPEVHRMLERARTLKEQAALAGA